jgi:hypothetical protein
VKTKTTAATALAMARTFLTADALHRLGEQDTHDGEQEDAWAPK